MNRNIEFAKMFFMGIRFFALLNAGAVLLTGALLVACLDIPSDPSSSSKITSVTVFTKQNGIADSVLLKVSSSDTSKIVARVYPNKYQDLVTYYWYNDDDLLDSGKYYHISANIIQAGELTKLFIPNKLIVKDPESNFLEKTFSVVVNAPPKISDTTVPAHNDTLYGDVHTAVLFTWQSFDNDTRQELEHTLEVDGEHYAVGSLRQVRQSGFKPGSHKFRIIVSDPYGDADTTSEKTFFMKDSQGGGK